VADIDLASAESVATAIIAAGGRACALRVDVSAADAFEQLKNETLTRFGQIDSVPSSPPFYYLARTLLV